MDNLETYKNIFSETFDVGPENVESLKYESIPEWDSVGHMVLIAALEEAFGISIEMEDVIDFSDFHFGKELLSKYGISIN